MSDGTAHCPRGASHHLVGSWGSRRQTTITRDRKVLSSVRAHGAAPAAIARPSTPLHTHPHFLPAPPRLPNVCVFDHDLTSCMPPQSPCVLTSGLLYMYQYLTSSVRVCRPSPHFPASVPNFTTPTITAWRRRRRPPLLLFPHRVAFRLCACALRVRLCAYVSRLTS